MKTSTAIVTIDIQTDYFPGGAFPLWRPGRALKATRKVLDLGRACGLPVFHVRHESLKAGARFLVAGSRGTELHPGLGIPADGSEPVIIKHEPDSFLGTDLEQRLRDCGAQRVIWMGMMTWMCVDTTVRSAAAKGFTNILVADACASGWNLYRGLPVFPWTSDRTFLAALGQGFCDLTSSKRVRL